MKNPRGRTNSPIFFKPDRLSKTFKDELNKVYILINELNFASYTELQNGFNAQQ